MELDVPFRPTLRALGLCLQERSFRCETDEEPVFRTVNSPSKGS